MSQRVWAACIAVAGAAGVLYAFQLQSQAESDSRVRAISGLRPEQTYAPWAVGAIGVVLIVVAVVLFATARKS